MISLDVTPVPTMAFEQINAFNMAWTALAVQTATITMIIGFVIGAAAVWVYYRNKEDGE